jgi:ubiquinone/menaquinone biosynthesis C-methylase UbiE
MDIIDPTKLSYSDFLGLIKADNKPPGEEVTLDNWISWGRINRSSIILDLACSSGFSSRYISKKTGCKAIGIDLSKLAIVDAISKSVALNCNYYCENAEIMSRFSDATFTHIIAGSTFGFIKNPSLALQQCKRVLVQKGVLLTSNYYHKTNPPLAVLNKVSKIIGLSRKPHREEKIWNNFYSTYFLEKWSAVIQFKLINKNQIKGKVKTEIYENPLISDFDDFTKDKMFSIHLRNRIAFEKLRYYLYFDNRVWQKK